MRQLRPGGGGGGGGEGIPVCPIFFLLDTNVA